MLWLKRLRYYAIGLVLGVLLAYFFYGDRACNFLPRKQVLQNLRMSDLIITEKSQCLFNCLGISQIDIFTLLQDSVGSVIFSESHPRNIPKEYIVEGIVNSKELKAAFLISDSTFSVKSIQSSKSICKSCGDKDDKNIVQTGKNVSRILYDLSNKTIIITPDVKLQLQILGFDSIDVFSAMENGKVDMSKSLWMRMPYPEYVVTSTINGVRVDMMFENGTEARLIYIEKTE